MSLVMRAPLGWLRGLLLAGLSVNIAAMILNALTGTADTTNRVFGYALSVLMFSLFLSLGRSRLLTKIALILGVLLLQGIWFDALYLDATPGYRQIALFSIALWLPFFYLLFFFIFDRKTAPWLAGGFVAVFTLVSLPHTFVSAKDTDIFDSLRFLPLTALAHLLFIVTFRLFQQREAELAQLRADQSYLKHLAEHDLLTGLPNRRALEVLYPKLARPLGVIMFDIDHFKHYNDLHGHLAGDVVLKNVAATLRAHARVGDVVTRWGGEEFLVLAPETDLLASHHLAERLAGAVAEGTEVTLSGGVVSSAAATLEDVLIYTDAALYEAKRSGRAQIKPG